MAYIKSELAKGSPEALSGWEQRLAAIEKFVPPDHPRYREYEEMAAKAKSVLNQALTASQIPQGWKIIQSAMEKLTDYYERMTQIRGEVVFDRVQKALAGPAKLPPASAVSALEKQIDSLRDISALAPIANDLQAILGALSVNPKDVLEGVKTSGVQFYLPYKGRLTFDAGKVEWAKRKIGETGEKMRGVHPALPGILSSLEAGILQIEASDPAHAGSYQWWLKYMAPPAVSYGVRVFGGLAGGLFAGVGLLTAVIGKRPLSWPIALWSGIAAYCANPDLFKGSGDRSLQLSSTVNTQKAHEYITRGFKGKRGEQALSELDEIARTRPADLQTAKRAKELSPAQLGALTENPERSALYEILSKFPGKERGSVLQEFAKNNRNEQELLRELVRTRDEVKPIAT